MWTGTITVMPSSVTALWSEGPRRRGGWRRRRLGSASRDAEGLQLRDQSARLSRGDGRSSASERLLIGEGSAMGVRAARRLPRGGRRWRATSSSGRA